SGPVRRRARILRPARAAGVRRGRSPRRASRPPRGPDVQDPRHRLAPPLTPPYCSTVRSRRPCTSTSSRLVGRPRALRSRFPGRTVPMRHHLLFLARTLPLALIACLSATPLLAQGGPQGDSASTRPARNPMQNGLPLEPTRTLTYTATEGSWMSVDVSPDGGTLVFDLLGDIYTMPITGGRATPLTTGMAYDAQPRFSPDGTRIVFTSDRSGGEGVWTMSLDLKDTAQVTTGKTTKYDSPDWTPDGSYIVVTRGINLHLYHVDGGAGAQLIRASQSAGGGPGGSGQSNQRYM